MSDERQHKRPSWREFTADETATLEIISTQELKAMLDGGDDSRGAIEDLARSDADGVIGRDRLTGDLGVLQPESLESLMNEDKPLPKRRRPAARRQAPEFGFAPAGSERAAKTAESVRRRLEAGADDELELVDTQMLRALLDEDRIAQGKPPKYAVDEAPGGGKNIYERAEPARGREQSGRGFNPYDSPGRPKR